MLCPASATQLDAAGRRSPDIFVLLRACLYGCTLMLLLAGQVLAQGNDGYIGIYADSAGTLPCTTVEEFAELYVIAKLSGATAAGIRAAEFRITVENPDGWWFSCGWHPARTQAGDPMDLEPDRHDSGSGIRLAWDPCLFPVAGQVCLGKIHVVRAAKAQPTRMFVRGHGAPSLPGCSWALLQGCSPSDSSWHSVTPNGECCSLQEPDDIGASFVTGLNIGSDNRPHKLTAHQLVALLWSDLDLAISFIHADSIRPVITWHGESAEDLLQELLSADPQYRLRTILGRRVIYPTSGLLDRSVHLPPDLCVDEARHRAMVHYAEWLRTHVPGFGDLSPPPFIGDPRGLARQERITLSRDATVVEHLLQLIGNDPHRVIALVPGPFGGKWLTTHPVPWPPE